MCSPDTYSFRPDTYSFPWGTDFSEDVVCTTDKQVTFRGGYNEAYASQDGTSTLHGSLSISGGVVIIEVVNIM